MRLRAALVTENALCCHLFRIITFDRFAIFSIQYYYWACCVRMAASNGEHDISWALKLLERGPHDERSFLNQYWSYIGSMGTCLTVPAGVNYWLNRPLYAGIQRYAGAVVIGLGVGHLLTKRDRYVCARRDAIMRDYIRLHPEDFPEPERKKLKEIFPPWYPIR